MSERLELMRAMKESPHHVEEGACDFVPALELIGIYIARTTVTRMYHNGEIEANTAAFLNGALGAHAFCVLHHCTHESISQHNPEHEKFENMVFRLGNLILFFDDGYKVAHRRHHQRANKHDDPDAILSHTSLPVLGSLIESLNHKSYISLGAPLSVRMATFGYHTGLLDFFRKFPSIANKSHLIEWNNVKLKMASLEALEVLGKHKRYEKFAETLDTTWIASNWCSTFILGLFFARYPHRNGTTMENEVDSFYDNTYRSEAEQDLWMMGEGAHHLHHAKSDYSYSYLPKISDDIDQKHPHLSTNARGTTDLDSIEWTHTMPPKRGGNAPAQNQYFWERTCRILDAMELLGEDKEEAMVEISKAVIESAIYCCTKSDKSLLRRIHKGMKIGKGPGFLDGFYGIFTKFEEKKVPFHSFSETVFADETAEDIASKSEFIIEQVAQVAAGVGKKIEPMKNGEEIKEKYFDTFIALADYHVSEAEQEQFLKDLVKSLGVRGPPLDRKTIIEILRSELESPVPNDFLKSDYETSNVTQNDVRRKVVEMVAGPTSRL